MLKRSFDRRLLCSNYHNFKFFPNDFLDNENAKCFCNK
uniref:Uncharacterized protein n=1 Tax=Anguilla anguilla TaxID=7936 RepID=A0A0E9PQ79_ANGAN